MATKKPKALPPYLTVQPEQPLNYDALDAFLGGLQPPAAEPEGSGMIRRTLGDGGVSLLKGAIGVPEALVGMADLATGGRAGKLAEEAGFRPKEAKQILDEYYSAEQQAANRKVQQADGFLNTVAAALENPSTIVHGALESAPSFIPAGVATRGLLKIAPKMSTALAAGAGEGLVSAGQTAEQVRQQTKDGLLTGEQSALVAASGGLTGLIGSVAGKVANKLGIGDLNQLVAGVKNAGPVAQKGVVRSILEGFATEGILQELPQSAQEQIAQNVALGKPWDEGVGNAAAMGALSGGLMGGAAAPFGHDAAGNPAPTPTPGDQIRTTKLPETGVLTKGINAGVEAAAQAAEKVAPVVPDLQTSLGVAAPVLEGSIPFEPTAAIDTGSLALGDAQQTAEQNVAAAAQRMPPIALEDAQRLQAAGQEQGRSFAIVPHPAGGGFMVLPRQWVTKAIAEPAQEDPRAQQALRAADELTLEGAPPAKPMSLALGYDTRPTGTIIVDESGAARPETRADRINRAQEAERRTESGLTPDVERASMRAAMGTATQEGDILTPHGLPFRNAKAAQVAAKRKGAGFEAVQIGPDAFVVRAQREPEPLQQRQAETLPAAEVQAHEPLLNEPVELAQSPAAQPDVIQTAAGAPFKSKVIAERRAKLNPGYQVHAVDGGWILRKGGADARSVPERSAVGGVVDAGASPGADGMVREPGGRVPAEGTGAGADVRADAVSTGRGNDHALSNKEWTAFAPESGTKGIPRADMPQIKAEHRGAMVNFLKARGIKHESDTVAADSLKPTQAEYSPTKVEKAKAFTGGDRSILVSSDGHVVDGHHQWLAKHQAGEPVNVIRLKAPIDELLPHVKAFPSAEAADGATRAPAETASQNAEPAVDEAAPASHQDQGQAAEPATTGVIGESMKKAGQAQDRKPSAMRDELLTMVDDAVKEAPDYGDFQESVKTLGLKDAVAVFTDAKGTMGQKHAPSDYSRPTRTFDVPGDGKFTVNNTVRQLLTFRQKVQLSAGFKSGKTAAPAVERVSDANDKRNADNAIANMVAEGDFQAASDYADAVGVSLDEAKLSKGDRDKLNRWLDAKNAKPVEASEAPKTEPKQAESAAPVEAPAVDPDAGIASQTFDQWVKAKLDGSNYKDAYLEAFDGDERKAMLGAAIGSAGGTLTSAELLKEARNRYWQTLIALPREASISRQVYESLNDGQRRDAQMHFFGLDSTVIRWTQEGAKKRAVKTAPEVAASQGPEAQEVGPFGPILTQYRGDAQGAIKALTELQDGEAVAALNHPDVGDIDLVWGKEGTADKEYEDGMGLAKIIMKHSEVLDDLQGFVSSLSVQKRSENRVILSNGSGKALVRLDWDGKAKHWLLTAYDDEKKASVANEGRTGVSAGTESAPPADQGTEAASSVSPADSTGKVENFGEKLPPARRALAAKLDQALSNDDIAKLPLSQVWPVAENEAIEEAFPAAVAHVMREAVPAKPRVAYKVEAWVGKVNLLRGFAAKIVSGRVSRDVFMEEIAKLYGLRDIHSKIKLLEQIDREQWKRVGEVSESPNAIRYEDGKSIPMPSVSVSIDGKSHWLKGSGDVLAHVDVIKAMLGTEAPESRMQFEIRQESHGARKVFVNKKGDKEQRRLMEFDTVAQARAAISERYADLLAAWEGVKSRDNITERDLRGEENRPRTGKDHRQGRDVSGEEFQQRFGFRGGEFGGWLKQGKGAQERQTMLNNTYDALMDLSDLLGIPPRAISLEGALGIALGSRGSGWASAHFEPSNLVINLTKTRGAGALAHEWFHALDNYFARKRGGEVPFTGDQLAYRQGNYITYKTAPMMVRKDRRSSPVTRERLEEWRRQSPGSAYLAEDQWQIDPDHKPGVRAEVEERFAELVKALNASPMLKRAKVLDGSGEEGYWARIIERAARSFENFVLDRMLTQGYHNDFLANVKSAPQVGKNAERYPYLLPHEVAPVAEAFGNLFDTIQTREDEAGNVVMFRRSITPRVSVEQNSDGHPVFNGDAVRLEFPAVTQRVEVIETAGQQVLNYVVMPARGFEALGYVELLIENGKPVSLLDIEVAKKGRALGVGRDVIETILAANPTSELNISNIVPSARGFWEKMGIPAQNVEGSYDGTLTWQTYSEAQDTGRAGGPARASRAAGKGSDAGAEVGSRGAPSPTPGKSDEVARVEAAAGRLTAKWANAPRVVVVESMSDPRIPQEVRDEDAKQRSGGSSGDPEGFYFKGVAYLNATMLADDAAVRRVLFHEALGHFGLRKLYGKELQGILEQLVRARPAEVRVKAKEYGLDPSNDDDLIAAAEEVLAEMAQTRPELGFVRRAVAAVRNFLRRIGLNLRLSDDEIIKDWILPARRFVEGGGPGPKGGQRIEPKFSREPGGTPMFSRSPAEAVAKITPQLVKDMLAGGEFKQVSAWHKTVGSPYDLAQKNPEFRKVFEGAQAYINDVSFFANTAADAAPRVMPQLNELRDLTKALTLPEKDRKALAAPVFEGTLIWGRDGKGKLRKIEDMRADADALTSEEKARELFRSGYVSEDELKRWQASPLDIYDGAVRNRYEKHFLAEGVVFTAEELRKQFGLDDRQIDLYQETRAAIDSSLDAAMAGDAIRYLGEHAPDGAIGMARAGEYAELRKLLETHLENLPEGALFDEIRAALPEKYERIDSLKSRGYAPLMRFGQYSVRVADADGGTKFFSLYESPADAAKAARELAADPEFQGLPITKGMMSQEEFKLLKGLTPETLSLFASITGTDKDEAMQVWLKQATSNRSALRRLIHRQGIAGFSEDVTRVLSAFVTSNARSASQGLHFGEMQENVSAIRAGDVKDAAERLREYVQNPTEEAAGLRGFLFAHFLGGSISSAAVNMTQPFLMTMPYLSRFVGIAKAGKLLAQGMKQLTGGVGGDLKDALDLAEKEGIVSPQELHQLQAMAMGRGNLLGRAARLVGASEEISSKLDAAGKRALFIWGAPFAMAEQFNRRLTFIAAYQLAVEQGMAKPFDFAAKAVTETQGIYNKGNRPEWARGAIGATLFTFKQYTVNYLEFTKRLWMAGEAGSEERAMGRKAALFGLALLLLAAGAQGLPGADDLDDLIDTIGQRMGYDTNSKRWKNQRLPAWLQYGLSAIPGFPLDVAGRMGLGNLIPGTGLLRLDKSDKSGDVLEIAGAVGSVARSAIQAADAGSIRPMLPTAISNLAKAADMADTGAYRDTKGRRVVDASIADAVVKGIGFQPATVAAASREDGQQISRITLAKNTEAAIVADWAEARYEGDQKGEAAARQRLADWNARNPDTPIRIQMTQIIRRVRDMRTTRAERIKKSTPKELRGQAL